MREHDPIAEARLRIECGGGRPRPLGERLVGVLEPGPVPPGGLVPGGRVADDRDQRPVGVGAEEALHVRRVAAEARREAGDDALRLGVEVLVVEPRIEVGGEVAVEHVPLALDRRERDAALEDLPLEPGQEQEREDVMPRLEPRLLLLHVAVAEVQVDGRLVEQLEPRRRDARGRSAATPTSGDGRCRSRSGGRGTRGGRRRAGSAACRRSAGSGRRGREARGRRPDARAARGRARGIRRARRAARARRRPRRPRRASRPSPARGQAYPPSV